MNIAAGENLETGFIDRLQKKRRETAEIDKIVRICEVEAYKRRTFTKCEASWLQYKQLLGERHGLRIETRGVFQEPTLAQKINVLLDAGYALAEQLAGVIAEPVPRRPMTVSDERKVGTLIQQLTDLRSKMRNLRPHVIDMVDPAFLRDCAAGVDEFLSTLNFDEIASNHAMRMQSLGKPYEVIDWSSENSRGVVQTRLNWLATKSAAFFGSLETHIENSAKKLKASNSVRIVRIKDVVTIEKSPIDIPTYVELDWLFDLVNRIDGYGYEWYPASRSSDETVILYW